MLTPERSNPYVGPYSFDEKDADLFFGRNDEARRLLSLVVSERVVVFVSPSGAGKTSLLNVRLVPELRKKGYHVLPVARVGGEMTPGISPTNVFAFNTLCSLANGTADLAALVTQTLDGFLHLTQQDAAEQSLARVLILDQFEEIFTTHPGRWEDRRSFFVQLRQALLNDPALSVVLTLREDHLAGLEPFAALLPGQLRNRFRLEPLHRDRAVDAVRRPAEVAGRPFDEGVAELLVDNLSQEHRPGEDAMFPGELIEPVQLQVVCFQLWENLRGRPGKTITEQNCHELGNVDQALERFYDSAVKRAALESGVPALKIRRWCSTALITPTRIRGQVSRDARTSGGLPNSAADWLVNLHLIRPEVTRGGIWYELAHDRFIDPVLRSNTKAQPAEASSLAGDAKAWQEGARDISFLYRGQRLKKAEETTEDSSLALTSLEREFLSESRRAEDARRTRQTQRLQLLSAGLCILLLALSWLIFVTLQEKRLSRSRELASNALIRAEADPDLGLRLALKAVQKAETLEAEAALHRVLNIPVVRQGQSLPIVSDSAGAFSFSPDGSHFATVTEKNQVSLRDSKTGQRLLTLPAVSSVITALEFSPTGGQLAVGGDNGTVTLWRADTGARIWESPLGSPINSMAFSPNGTLLAVATNLPVTPLLRTATGERVRSLSHGHSKTVWSVAFDAKGTRAATVGEDGLAIVWDVKSGHRIGEPFRHPEPTTGVAFSPDGELATACQDHLIRIWDAQAGRGILKILAGHQDWVWSLSYSPDGQYLASASFDKTAKLWDTKLGKEIRTFPAVGPVLRVSFQPGSSNHALLLAVTSRRWADSKGLLSFSSILLEDVTTLHSPTRIVDADFRPQSTSLVATTQEGRTTFWDLRGRTDSVPLNLSLPPGAQIKHARLSLDGRQIVTVETLGKEKELSNLLLRIRDTSSGQEVLKRNLKRPYLPSINISSSGRLLMAAQDLRFWNLQNEQEVPFPRLVEHLAASESPILLATLSPDGRRLATANLDLSIRLWEVGTGRELQTLRGHTTQVTALAFSPDSRRLASGSGDASVKLWDAENGRELFALYGHTKAITALAFSPDGKWLATAGAEGTVRLEPMKIEDLVVIARARQLRYSGPILPGHQPYLHEVVSSFFSFPSSIVRASR